MKKTIVKIWDYFRNSWEGEDGKFSYKRACQFIFVWLIAGMILKGTVKTRWDFYVFLTVAILFTLTATIITVPQLIKMIKYYSKVRTSEQYPQYHYDESGEGKVTETTETTETVKPVDPPPGDM